jgi:hypothetical protein
MVAGFDTLARSPSAVRRQRVVALVHLGRLGEALDECREEFASSEAGERWLSDLVVDAMTHRDLSYAGGLATILTALQRGSEWYPRGGRERPLPKLERHITLPKLRHDLNQLCYLQSLSPLGPELEEVIDGYVATLDRYAGAGDNTRLPFTPEDEARIGRVYGRVIHLAHAPRLDRVLSGSWDPQTVQRRYQQERPGVVVIDDFLTREALECIRRFSLESTCWAGNRFANGRLSALFLTGFNCPLLLQVAEEFRDALPELIGDHHPLKQLWAFKYTSDLPPDSTIHADFAAVNVNFWITPDDANLDPSSGGMQIYDIDAPLSWDFATYNQRADIIRPFLASRRARSIRVPYKQNRAVIFNSDLFHTTEAVHFRPDYASHRINVTMLYGNRNLDRHYPPEPGPSAVTTSSARRSLAFSRSRR